MEYFVGVVMSAMPFLCLSLVVGAFLYVILDYKPKRAFKATLVVAAFGLLFAAIMPSNTYKHKAERLPNPTAQRQGGEIIANDLEIRRDEKIERKKRFDEMVDWKQSYN